MASYRKAIHDFIDSIPDSEVKFLCQIYTILKRHFERKGGLTE